MMCLSGFEESHKHSLIRLLRALGITLASVFNRRNTHLLCRSPTGTKYEKAQEWGIPVVSLTWLRELTKTGRIPDVRANIKTEVPARDASVAWNAVEVEMIDDSKVTKKSVDKGKGRATSPELDGPMELDIDKMQDITNSKYPANDYPAFHGSHICRCCRTSFQVTTSDTRSSRASASEHGPSSGSKTSRRERVCLWPTERDAL